MNDKKLKDKCDNCGKFAILKGVDSLGKCFCENCINSYSPKKQKQEEKQLTIFDVLEVQK